MAHHQRSRWRPLCYKNCHWMVINGPMRKELESSENKQPQCSVNKISVTEVEKLLVQQYNADFLERNYNDKEELSENDQHFMQSVQKSAVLEDGHYHIGLPLREAKPQMPNKRCLAEQRATSLRRKFRRNPEFFDEYKAFMDSIISKGYARQVPAHQLKCDDNRVFYIPHHGVNHLKKRKLRVVFRGMVLYQGQSLNSEILLGPDLTNTLVGVLLGFWQEPIAMMAEIELMFYQIKVPEGDADVLRFLWWPDGNLDGAIKEFRMIVHLLGATSSQSVASYTLERITGDHKATASQEADRTGLCNFYVDDS